MRDDQTLSERARLSATRRRSLRRLVVLGIIVGGLAAAWSVVGDRVFFLRSIDGIVVRKTVRRVVVTRGSERDEQDRYTVTIREADGEDHELDVPHDVFIQVSEGAPCRKSRFSSRINE